jgi:hypothetical protein
LSDAFRCGWIAASNTTKSEIESLKEYAALGKVAMKFVDRAGDVHPGIDDADTICHDFYLAMCNEFNTTRK